MKKIKCILQHKKTNEYLSYEFNDLTSYEDFDEYKDKNALKNYLRKALIFTSKTDAFETLKEHSIKKSDFNFIELKKGDTNLNQLIIKEAFEYYNKYKDNTNFDLDKDLSLIHLNYLDNATKSYNSSMSLKDYIKNDIENEKVKKIHARQFLTDADRASILLLQENSKNEILINNLNNSDGTCKVAIVKESEKLIPDYYKRSKIVLNGKFKIMISDCAKNYTDDGFEIEGFYFIYQAGFSYIFEKLGD